VFKEKKEMFNFFHHKKPVMLMMILAHDQKGFFLSCFFNKLH